MTLRELALLTATMIAASMIHAADKNETAGTMRQRADARKATPTSDAPAPRTIHVRVVDESGTGVEGAEVEISWHSDAWRPGKPDVPKTVRKETDADGTCQADLENPVRVYISSVLKDGYERTVKGGNTLFDPATTKDNPIIAVLRKKGPPIFLISSPDRGRVFDTLLQVGTNSISRPFDLLAWERGKNWDDSIATNADLRIDSVFDAASNCWKFTYSIINGPGGIVLSDEMLYEAPADGYASDISITHSANNRHGQWKYLYVRSRTPEIYSRVLLLHLMHAGELEVSSSVWTNPYGERGLEYEERIGRHWKALGILTEEAKTAIRSGKRLSKPEDIEQLAKEIHERVAREEDEKRRQEDELRQQQRMLREAKAREDARKASYDRIPPAQTFYGRVIGQDQNGVENAEVTVHWESAEWLLGKERVVNVKTAKTDSSGNWEMVLEKPSRASLWAVEKDGYAPLSDYGDKRDLMDRPISREMPILSHLRDKGVQTFLIISPRDDPWTDTLFEIDGTNSISRPFDLLAWEPTSGWRSNTATNADLWINAVFDATGQCWNITYSITNGPGGVVPSYKELPDEAPVDGYVPSISVSASTNDIHGTWIAMHVKSRASEIYSKVLIKHSVRTGEHPGLQVEGRVWTNPYGGRSLEFDVQLDGERDIVQQLRCEALDALASGKYPKNRDIARFVREIKDRVWLEREENERKARKW